MPHRLEITLKARSVRRRGRGDPPEGRGLFRNSHRPRPHGSRGDHRCGPVERADRNACGREIFTNPVTQVSSYAPLDDCLRLDASGSVTGPVCGTTPAATAVEAIEDLLGVGSGPRRGRLHLQALLPAGEPASAAEDVDTHRRRAAGQRHHPAVAGVMPPKTGTRQRGSGIIIPRVQSGPRAHGDDHSHRQRRRPASGSATSATWP